MNVRIGVIGTGMIGQEHIRRITEVVPGAEVVAVTDADAARAAQVAASVGARALPTGKDVITDGAVHTGVTADWQQRFGTAFDREFVDWVSEMDGDPTGPGAWDGYAVALTSDATVQAQRTGDVVAISIPERPAFYRS